MIRIALLTLLLPCLLHAQEERALTRRPKPVELAAARDMIRNDADKTTNLKYGGYATIRIEVAGELTSYVVPGSDDCIKTEIIPKGKSHASFKVRNTSDDGFVWVEVEPDAKYDRLLVQGFGNGTSTVLWLTVENGKPVVVDGFKFVVGKPKPPAPPPDTLTDFEKQLKAAMERDVAASKGTRQHAEKLAAVYRAAANNLPTASTVDALYRAMQQAFTAEGVPSPSASLTTMRQAIAAELNKRLPTEADKQLTLEDRNRVTAAFNYMADSIEAILK